MKQEWIDRLKELLLELEECNDIELELAMEHVSSAIDELLDIQ
jgi:hypothetical protein